MLFRRHGKHEKRKEIDWIAEIRIAFLTSLFFLIVSTVFFWMIRQISPGEFTGKRLEEYLLSQISREIGIPYSEATITLTQKKRFQTAEDSTDSLVLYGNYTANNPPDEAGRFVFIFERKPMSVWNDLFSTKANYEITFASTCQEIGIYTDTLLCDNCSIEDLDKDGSNEIIFQFQSIYADRVSNSYMILQKDERWRILVPNLSNLDAEVDNAAGQGNMVMLDEFHFHNLLVADEEQTILYGQPYHGTIHIVENPLWGGIDILYCVAVNDRMTGGLLLTHHSAYVMERYTEHGLFRDTNWNGGHVLYVDENNLQLEEMIDALWGYQSGSGVIFYSNDVGKYH